MRSSAKKNSRRLVVLLASVAVCAGCSTVAVIPAPEIPARSILEKIVRMEARIDTVQAVARIEVSSAKRRYPLTVALMVKRPAFLKIESIPLIGTPDFFLSLRDDILKVFLPFKHEFYIGRATSDNLALFLPIHIPQKEMVPILMGLPPSLEMATGADNLPVMREGNLYRLDMPLGNGKRQSLRIDPLTGDLVGMEMFDGYRRRYTVLYEEYGKEGDIPMPRRVMITSDEEDNPKIVVRYSDIRFSTTTDTTPFDLAVPAGMEPITLF